VPLGVAVSGRQSCERFAPLADVMIAVEPDGSLAGFTDLALVQIGGTEPEQARFFAAAPELITAVQETAGSS
jgi:hypothetical protein